ncbi:MAG: DHA2 family efflux MFS transporter permease subunit [Alphaproteobacteria bacterium]|nr:DHA2 family efflux MFS transporter permease subunit [Alphaproteobacteria bacterium]
MSATAASSAPTVAVPYRNVILFSVVVCSSLQSMDTFLAAVALPNMKGELSASQDEISWVLTSYLIAIAIASPPIGWLSRRIGRKRFMLINIVLFLFFSMLAGRSATLDEIVACRFLQGLAAAALVPLSHHIILDVFPKDRVGFALGWWSVGVMFGAIVGPTLGGALTEYMSWRWVFYVNLPMGMLALVMIAIFLPESERDAKQRFDWSGFIMLTVALISMQLMLDRGNKLDWFESTEIVIEGCLSIVFFYAFVVHILTARQPFLDARIFLNRNFTIGLVLATMHGVVMVGLTGLLPPFLQLLMGMPVLTVGLIMAPRGLATAVTATISGRLLAFLDPRPVILAGMALIAFSMWMMSAFTPETSVIYFVIVVLLQGTGFGMFFVPVNTAAFATLPPHYRGDATAFMSLMRKIGSSVGVSILVGQYIRMAQSNHAVLAQHVTPYTETLRLQPLPELWSLTDLRGIASLDREVHHQAQFLAYLHDFQWIALFIVLLMPLILFLQNPMRPKK